jgi:hypothetical protein
MASRGLNVADPRLARAMQKRMGAALRHMRGRGTVRSDRLHGGRMGWQLA